MTGIQGEPVNQALQSLLMQPSGFRPATEGQVGSQFGRIFVNRLLNPRFNEGGGFSTEVTKTVELPDGRFALVPGLFDGVMTKSDDEALDKALERREVIAIGTREELDRLAPQRSRSFDLFFNRGGPNKPRIESLLVRPRDRPQR